MSLLTLLLIDDEKDLLEVLKDCLESEFGKILTANSGQEGLQILRKEKIDIVITDLSMPNATGLQVIKELRGEGHKAKVILMTGYAEGPELKKAQRELNFSVINKPATPSDILDEVKRITSA